MAEANIDKNSQSEEVAPLEIHGFERVAHKGDFPTMFDLVAMLLIIVVSQIAVSIVGVVLGLPMPNMLSGDIVDIEQSGGFYRIKSVLDRKNELVRPSVANIDKLVIVL